MKDLTKLTDRIFYVGVNDRTKHLFEGLWPLPLGVSYNAYLVCGERTALVDTVDACFTAVCWPTSANGWATDRWIIW